MELEKKKEVKKGWLSVPGDKKSVKGGIKVKNAKMTSKRADHSGGRKKKKESKKAHKNPPKSGKSWRKLENHIVVALCCGMNFQPNVKGVECNSRRTGSVTGF